MGLDDSTGGERQTNCCNSPMQHMDSNRFVVLLHMNLLGSGPTLRFELLWDATDSTFLPKMHCVHCFVRVNNKVSRQNNTHTGQHLAALGGIQSITLHSLSSYDSSVLHWLADQREEKKKRAQYLKEAGLGEREEQKHLNKDDFQIVKLISNGAYRWDWCLNDAERQEEGMPLNGGSGKRVNCCRILESSNPVSCVQT